jgi:alkylation response protein AidB-like acyl-CoA dehydrogenase
VINGAKMWATNASIADTIVVLCRTDPAGGSRSLSQILVPTDTPGVIIGPPEKKMGLNGSPTHAVTFDNVRVPLENLLGEEGRGLQQTLATLKQRAHQHRRAGAGHRAGRLRARAWPTPNSAKPSASPSPISRRSSSCSPTPPPNCTPPALMLYHAAWLKDQGQPFATQAGMAKLFATEVSERVCRNAIQIHGGYGYSREYEVERMYRDTRLMSIGEGTSEIQRMVIARAILT